MNHRNPNIALSLAVSLALVFALAPAAMATTVVQESEVPAAGLDSIVVKAGSGSARIVTGADDRILIRVEISPRHWSDDNPFQAIKEWFLTSSYEDVDELVEAVRIDTEHKGEGKLRIGLTPSGSSRKDKVREAWTLTVPARMAVGLTMDAAEVEISGITGGAKVRAGAGSVQIDVPRGDLEIGLEVGDVDVSSGSGSLGAVDLQSTVGSTHLWMNGARIKYPNPPGPGSEVSVSGNGEDSVRVDVTVGDISVNVGGDA